MEFVILQDAEVSFPGPLTSEAKGLLGRISSSSLEAQILATKDDSNGTDNYNYSHQLANAIVKNPWSSCVGYKDTNINWSFKVAVSLPDPTRFAGDGDAGGNIDQVGEMKVFSKFYGPTNFLLILRNGFNHRTEGNNNLTMNVTVKNFGAKNRPFGCPSRVSWKAKGLMFETWQIKGELQLGFTYKHPAPLKPDILSAWKNGDEFCGTFTISLMLNGAALSMLDSVKLDPWRERFEHLEDMLKKEICTDLKIIAGVSPNQKVVKCHRAFLAAGSDVFQRMFESGMKEATGNKIEMKEMSEKGVRALLAYLYYKEVKAAYESSEIALELLQAGEKYDIQELKESVRDYMMAKEAKWFGVDVVLDLFGFVRALCPKKEEEIQDVEEEDIEMESVRSDEDLDEEEEDEEIQAWKSLKGKSLKVIRWYTKMKPKTLLESTKYQEIFGGNLKLGMEVSSGMLRLD